MNTKKQKRGVKHEHIQHAVGSPETHTGDKLRREKLRISRRGQLLHGEQNQRGTDIRDVKLGHSLRDVQREEDEVGVQADGIMAGAG